MPIPRQSRIIVDQNPLAEVVFQARFPHLLEIERDLPVPFHSAIRDLFPNFDTAKLVEFPVGSTPDTIAAPVERRQFEMGSRDLFWKVSLTADFVALTTSRYTTWEELRHNLCTLLDAFFAVYKPAFISRTGLRYRNSISRRRYGIENVAWKELIRPHLAGPLADDHISPEEIEGYRAVFVLKVRDDLKVQVQHGTAKVAGDEVEYLIDCDYYTEAEKEANTHATLATLDGFRPLPDDLFHWCITDRLRVAMGSREEEE
jgi:uncharacterized protein (TIGR04255 family)